MKASDYIADFIYVQGVTHVFEVVGGMITHLIDSMYRQGNIRIVSMHHEQAAAFAAEGFARITGIPGVAMATSGPGAVNLLTGIGSCFFDSIPAVFITGQVNVAEMKGDRPIRQLGFQETDIVSMAKSITKAAWCLTSPEEIPARLEQAFQIALSGRPGPVLLDIPMDVQRADIIANRPQKINPVETATTKSIAFESLIKQIQDAQRPLILAGGGLRSAQAITLFRQFVDQIGVPVVNSLLAADALPYSNPFRVGLIGTYGNRWANLAIGEADFLLVLGSRLDIRQTGAEIETFKDNRVIYHVDCDPEEINNRIKGCIPVVSDLRSFLSEAIAVSSGQIFPDRANWLSKIASLKKNWPDTAELQDIPGINPNVFLHQLSKSSPNMSAFAVDVGQHQMWASQSIELSSEQRFMTSGGMAAMGDSLPLAIGASFARSGQPLVVIAGDGGFQLNLQELQTVWQYRLPIKIIILNNKAYGMVRQFQQSYFEERYQSTIWGYSAPDFARIAEAFNIPALNIQTNDEVGPGLKQLWEDPNSSFLLQVYINTEANAYPKMAFGRPFTDMEPFAKPKAFGEK
jgi:acetolactate synthase-1/2/3 large subunit